MLKKYLYQFSHNCQLFFLIVKMEASRYTHYPFEFFFGFINRFTAIILLALFWYIVAQTSDGNLDANQLLYYYLIVGGLTQISFGRLGVGSSMIKKVKFGLLNADLIRPIEPFFYQYAKHTGWLIQSFVLAAILLVAGVVLNGAPINPAQAGVAIISLFLLNISFNKLIACISFYVVEASGIKNTFTHVLSLLQGFLIPVSLMPEQVQMIIFASPFAASLYLPAIVLLGEAVLWSHLMIGLLWGVVLFVLSNMLWRHSLKSYEAVGI